MDIRIYVSEYDCVNGDSPAMTAEEFAARLEILIEDGRQGGLSDQAIIAGLDAAAQALGEELP